MHKPNDVPESVRLFRRGKASAPYKNDLYNYVERIQVEMKAKMLGMSVAEMRTQRDIETTKFYDVLCKAT